MIFNLISAAVMAFAMIGVLCRAKLSATRRVAIVPGAACAVELLGMGLVPVGAFPLLTVLLVLLRVTMLLCCVAALRRDAAMVRAQKRRRARLRRELHAALNPLHAVPVTSAEPTVAKRIAS